MLDEIMHTVNEEYKKCWKHPDNIMLHWAKHMERHGSKSHGLGDVNKPCEAQAPGKQCPACGRCF